jgi:hypothetical protein
MSAKLSLKEPSGSIAHSDALMHHSLHGRYVYVDDPSSLAGVPPVPLRRASALPLEESKEEIKSPESKEPGMVMIPSSSAGKIRTLGTRGGAMSLPPPLSTTVRISHTFRFRATSTLTGVSCSFTNVLGALGGICTVANSVVRSFGSSLKISKLIAWPPASTTADVVFIDWDPQGSAQFVPDDSKVVTIPDGVSVSRALVFSPPRNSLASDWLNASAFSPTNILFGMTAPTGTIIDLHVTYTLSNVSGGLNQSVVAGTLGQVYFLPLDGPSSNKIRSVGVPSTA